MVKSIKVPKKQKPNIKGILQSLKSPISSIMPAKGNAPPRPAGNMQASPMPPPPPVVGGQPLGSLKKGGIVKKTGLYKLHAGEKVVPASPPPATQEQTSKKPKPSPEESSTLECRRCESPNDLLKRRGY